MLNVHINKNLEKYALNIDFSIDKEILGIYGPSGAGKSMTLKCIAGIENQYNGKVVLNDNILFDSEKKINVVPQKRHIAYLFQNYALFPQMTVWKNIYVSVKSTYSSEEKNNKVREVINLLKLNGLENMLPSNISGGEQQRVALARIIVNEAKFILLDEPFSALDSELKWDLIKEVKQIIEKLNIGAIFVSHDMEEIKYLATKIKRIEKRNICEAEF